MNRPTPAAQRLKACLRPLALALPVMLLPLSAQAAWPERALQLVVPFPAGSSPDAIARTLSDPLSAALGQPVVVENKPGAGGNIGTRQVAQAKPDGYTLLVTINGPIITAPTLYKKTLGYDPQKDLTPISLIGTSPNVLVVPEKSSARTVPDFVKQAKEKPGALNYGSVGPGSSSHLAMAMLEHEAGISLQQVPYKGFPDVITAIIAGDLHAGFMVPAIALPQVQAGKVRALGITSLQPSPVLPGIATLASQGYPDFESISWNALFVPGGTPADIVDKLNKHVTEILKRPEVQAKLANIHFTSEPSTPAEMHTRIQNEKARWDAVIERLKLSLD